MKYTYEELVIDYNEAFNGKVRFTRNRNSIIITGLKEDGAYTIVYNTNNDETYSFDVSIVMR